MAVNDRDAEPELPDDNDVGPVPVTVGSIERLSCRSGARCRCAGPHDELTTVAIDLSDVQSTVRSLVYAQVGIGAAVLLVLGIVGYRRRAIAACGRWSRSSRRRPPSPPASSIAVSRNVIREPRSAGCRWRSTACWPRSSGRWHPRRSSAEQARTSEDRMRRFITDASHELRTPLTTIRGFAELYRQGAARDVEMLMSRIESESRRMGLLVEDLLLLARLDAQRPLEQHRVDLLALATDAVHDAQSIAPQRRITMEVFDGPGTPEVLGDEARLRQVLGNLVANALQHTPDTARITVRVGTDRRRRGARGRRRGPGHEPARTRTGCSSGSTAPIHRATRASGGTGLGLSIVDSLVYAHGGTVTVTTAPGQGCRFRVSLPRIADVDQRTSTMRSRERERSTSLKPSRRAPP